MDVASYITYVASQCNLSRANSGKTITIKMCIKYMMERIDT